MSTFRIWKPHLEMGWRWRVGPLSGRTATKAGARRKALWALRQLGWEIEP